MVVWRRMLSPLQAIRPRRPFPVGHWAGLIFVPIVLPVAVLLAGARKLSRFRPTDPPPGPFAGVRAPKITGGSRRAAAAALDEPD